MSVVTDIMNQISDKIDRVKEEHSPPRGRRRFKPAKRKLKRS
jgi:hypothetical protein